MKNKQMLALIAILVVAIVIGSALAGCTSTTTNKQILDTMLDDFSTILSTQSAEIIESKGVYGKLNGNGNGVNYFGAALIAKDSVEDTDSLLAQLDETFETVGILETATQTVKTEYNIHQALQFDTVLSDSNIYICIYFYNSTHPDSTSADLAGH